MIALHRWHAALLVGAACLVPAGCGRESATSRGVAPRVEFVTDGFSPDFGSVRAFPLAPSQLSRFEATTPDEWSRVLRVHVDDTLGLAMLGTWEVAGDTLAFHPRFRPTPGVTWVARLAAGALDPETSAGGPLTAEWRFAPPAGEPTTRVLAVYPTADALPMNLLRLYVHFSAPMSTGNSYAHIRLYANGDSLLEEPFFTGGDAIELWDPDKTRLTILFDPGRIKRDLLPHEQRGLPLQEGLRYRLVIDSAWRDGEGQPLARPHEKVFTVGAMDRGLVRTGDWSVSAPASGTREALVVRFPEPLDHALLSRMLVVRGPTGNALAGESTVSEGERRWSFVPAAPWGRVAHVLEVDTELEDLAGNNLKRLFDVAPGDSAAEGVAQRHQTLSFTPR